MSGIPWLIAMGGGRECCRHYCICPASRQQRKPRSGIGRRYRAWRLLHLSGFRFTLCVACRMLSPTFIIQENSMTHALRHLPAAVTALLAAAALFHGPIHQPAGYHNFADQSLVWGVPPGQSHEHHVNPSN
jgi:hypothetical protein